MEICPTVGPSAGFITSVAASIDCNARVLGLGSWSGLAAPNSVLTTALTGLLTIFVAFVGYDLLLGGTITVRKGTLALAKVGAVVALVTSWPAYGTLVYGLATEGPSQLAQEIGSYAGIPASDGTLPQRLDLADETIAQLAILGPGNSQTAIVTPPPPFSGFDAFALGGSRVVFELTAVAALGIVRICTALMLALGPFFIALLLFGGTRSLFEGWIRVLCGSALAAFAVAITLGLELTVLEPWLVRSLAARAAGVDLPGLPGQLFVLTGAFSLLTLFASLACGRAASAFRLPLGTARTIVHALATRDRSFTQSTLELRSGARAREQGPSRAAVVANALLANVRRDVQPTIAGSRTLYGATGPSRRNSPDSGRHALVSSERAVKRSPIPRKSRHSVDRDSGR